MKLYILGKNTDDKGSQLEELTRDILATQGYGNIVTNSVYSGGSEIDVVASRKSLTGVNNMDYPVICECKAHDKAIVMTDWLKFIGKLYIAKLKNKYTIGLMLALSGANGNVVGSYNDIKDAIVESRSGMNKPGQPIGSFFLLEPTGTGKTELAKALAEALFNDEKAMIRFDMSEFKEEHSAALLYGAPPGYVGYEEGGLLVNKIRRQPYAVVLFDEIEKAHSSVYDIFLQIMDEGKLHDRLGKEGDFSNSIVLFTSNVGSEWLTKQINEGKNPSTTDLMEVMGSYFRPEFLARLSEIVPFSPINETMLVRIFEIQLKGVVALLDKQHISIEITEKAKNLLATRGFTPKYGARQVAGTIRNYIRRPISKMIVAGTLTAGNKVVVDVAENGEIDWNVK